MTRALFAGLLTSALLLPAAAFAAPSIVTTKHNLSVAAPAGNTVRATSNTEVCIFCHTPHHAQAQVPLWNRSLPTTDGWTSGSTMAGTTLATTLNQPTQRCLSCHDGTIAIGDVGNAGGGSPGTIAMSGVSATGMMLVASNGYVAPNMSGNHPVSMPYPTAGAVYNGITTAADPAGYFPVASASCTGGTSLCTTSTVAADGLAIRLYGTAAANAGIECGSCHEVHGTSYNYFLRVDINASAICYACHNK